VLVVHTRSLSEAVAPAQPPRVLRVDGRPAALAFSGDGRLFVAGDDNGVIFWIAPMP
jgi:hypothetical protein